MPSESTPTSFPAPAEAHTVFGDRLPLAEAYVDFLATAGIDRGLIGPREGERLWTRHVLNSTAVAHAIPDGNSERPVKVTDVGSGAGLPGIPVALCRPDVSVRLVEPLLRRTTFLTEFVDAHQLPITVVRGRAEDSDVVAEVGGSDVVTARAVAPLGKLAKWCAPLLREGGLFVALKGESAGDEVERDAKDLARAGLTDVRVEQVSVAGGEPTHLVIATRGATLNKVGRRRRR